MIRDVAMWADDMPIHVAVGEGTENSPLIHIRTQDSIAHSMPSPNLSTSNYPYPLDNI